CICLLLDSAAFWCILCSRANPVEEFEEIAIWIMQIHLLHSITTQHRATQNFNSVLLKPGLSYCQVLDFKCQVRCQASVFGRTSVHKPGGSTSVTGQDQV